MAKQHFYSRVPATASLYNQADGFDTFAQSQGLEEEFVQKELCVMYENKLGKRDVQSARAGEMSPVYSQCCLPTGELVQSCVSYFADESDNYLCHSLILSEEDQQKLFFAKEKALLNPRMFKTELAGLVKKQANGDYTEKAYTPVKVENPKMLVKQYEASVLKGFLFAVLSALCAKGKTVYFKLPYEDQELSQQALRFLSRIASVLPPQLRKNLSFVTYVSEPTQYAGIKVKCISPRFPEASLARGIYVDFNADVVQGLPEADVVAKAPVGFFYSLLEDTKTRDEFFAFMEQATQAVPELEKPTMKALADLVFLFGSTNARFDQEKILPTDEDVAGFLTTYEKYREALGEELRGNAYGCLKRYTENQKVIPKNIFSRITRLYPEEMPVIKAQILNMALGMLSADHMRDKMFAFLQINYENEDAASRGKIISAFCRAFEEGILQNQILDFFNEKFAQETPGLRRTIFDMLMRSVLAENGQKKILALVQNHYGLLNDGQKQRLYKKIFKMLPACDAMAKTLVSQVNYQMAQEPVEYQAQIAEEFVKLLIADYEKETHLLMPIMCAEQGYCRELVQKLAFGPWSESVLKNEYIALLAKTKPVEKTQELVKILSDIPEEKTAEILLQCAEQLYAGDAESTDIYCWFEIENLLYTAVTPLCEALAMQIRNRVVEPAVVARTEDLFNVYLRADGLKLIKEYAEGNPYIAESKQYAAVMDIVRMTDALREGTAMPVLCELAALVRKGGDHSRLSAYIARYLLDWEEQTLNRAVLSQMCCNVLKNGKFLSEELYKKAKKKSAPPKPKKLFKQMKAKADNAGATAAGELIWKVLLLAWRTDKVLAKAIYKDRLGMRIFLWTLRKDCGKDMNEWLSEILKRAPMPLAVMANELMASYKLPPIRLPKLSEIFAKRKKPAFAKPSAVKKLLAKLKKK